MTLEQILSRLNNVKRVGSGWIARCPAHNDRSPSLSIGEGRDGRVLLKCFAGCTANVICTAIGIKERDLFSSPREAHGAKPQIVRTMERGIADLRSRLTPRERVVLEPIVIVSTVENLDAAICRGLALAVEGELVQIALKEQHA